MLSCYQFQDMNILEHGQSVADWFADIHQHLYGSELKKSWKLPDWINEPGLKSRLLDFDILQMYQVYHDCGKPICRTLDDLGRQHFPCHAEASVKVWLEQSNKSLEALQIAKLIAMDMDIHILKSDGIQEFAERPEAVSLLLTGLAEIHSNAQMFGGVESTSFKIKWKHLNKVGKKIFEVYGSRTHILRV